MHTEFLGNVYSYLKNKYWLHCFLGFLNAKLSLKNAKMSYVALRPWWKNINRLFKHISTPLASFVAKKQSSMSERLTDCHPFMIQVLSWCHTDQANMDQHVLHAFFPLKTQVMT